MNRFRINKIWFWSCLIGVILVSFSCSEDLEDVVIPQFSHPQDVSLVCFDKVTGPLPIDFCKNSERTDAEIFAFVTQAEYGEVAVVNIEDYNIIDQDEHIPFNSFVPVGGRPEDIASSYDGTKVFTANYETRDISVVDVKTAIAGNDMKPAESINVEFPAAQIVVAQDVSGRDSSTSTIQDKFLFVSQPTVGRVAVVNVVPLTFTDAAGETRTIPKGVLGYLRLDDGILSSSQDDRPEGIAPLSMVASKRYASLYVGGKAKGLDGGDDGSYVVEIQREIFIDRAKKSFEQNGEALALNPEEMVIRRMDLNEFTVRDMSIEPELERWMYIVENELGGVIVLDLNSGDLVEANAWDLKADDAYSIAVPGLAKKVKLARFSETIPEGEEPHPLTFNGTYALVSTTKAAVFMIDVAIDESFTAQIEEYSSNLHSLHSSTPWYEDDDDDGFYEKIYPEATGEVLLYGDDDLISYDEPFMALSSVTDESNLDVCIGDETSFRMMQTEDTQNIYFNCDRRMSSEEKWQLTYQGSLGISGTAIIDEQAAALDKTSVVITDEFKNFCSAGLLGPAGLDLWGAFPNADYSGDYAQYKEYAGDLIEVTSEPTPFNAAQDCSDFEDEDLKKIYRVIEIIDTDKIRLEAIGGDGYAPLLSEQCFGQALTYRAKASDSWVLKGSSTGLLKSGSFQNGHCVPWVEDNNATWKNSRVFEDSDYENCYLKFHLNKVESFGNGKEKDDFDVLGFVFATMNGFSPMAAVIGSDITDIEVAPNNNVLFIDQSGKGLVLFDLIDDFTTVDEPIN